VKTRGEKFPSSIHLSHADQKLEEMACVPHVRVFLKPEPSCKSVETNVHRC